MGASFKHSINDKGIHADLEQSPPSAPTNAKKKLVTPPFLALPRRLHYTTLLGYPCKLLLAGQCQYHHVSHVTTSAVIA